MENALLLTGMTIGGFFLFPVLIEFFKNNASFLLVLGFLGLAYFMLGPEFAEDILFELRRLPSLLIENFG